MEARKLIKLTNETKEMNCSEVYAQFKMLIFKTIGEYKNTNLTSDELKSIGNMSLVKAFNKYKPEFGSSFSTLLVPVIRNDIKRELRLPTAQKRPSNVLSLNEIAFNNDECTEIKMNLVKDPTDYEEVAICNMECSQLKKLIQKLSPKKRKVLELFYFKEMNQRDIALQFDVRQPTISRQIKKTIKDLRVSYGVA